MDKFEPKETGLKRTVWLFEREILVNLEKTDLKDHHKVLTFNIFSMEYELNPEFDNGRADAIVMRNTANHWLKMWFVAFQTCASEKMQSRQSEFDAMTEALLNQTQLLAKKQAEVDQLKNLLEKDEHAHNLYYENANLQTLVEEKDKRIKQALMMIDHIQKVGLISSRYMVEDVQKALKGNDQYTEHHSRAEQQINKGARLTKHQIDLGDNNANS